MAEQNTAIDINNGNDRALRSLVRAISLSQGEFSVVLVCCNYGSLRNSILEKLTAMDWKSGRIQKIELSEHSLSLYTTIHFREQINKPAALMILGLELVKNIDDLLISVNQIRDEFRKRHPFPMVIWVNNEVLQKVVKLAPDFASWAATPIKFAMTSNALIEFLQKETDSLFSRALHNENSKNYQIKTHYSTIAQVWVHSYELHFAIKDLESRGIKLEPALTASLQFVFGLDDYVGDQINSALNHFRQSLLFWHQQATGEAQQISQEWDKGKIIEWDNLSPSPHLPTPATSHILKKGVLLLYIGLCYCRLAEQNQTETQQYFQSAKNHFQQCLDTFNIAGRTDLVAEFIGHLADVLQNLGEWQELQTVGEKSLELHQNYGSQIQLSCDYGLLAQVAIENSRWMQASILAHIALLQLGEAQKQREQNKLVFPLLLGQIYYLILAKAQKRIGENQIADEYLEKAKSELLISLENSEHQYDAHRYIRLLKNLRSLYFEAGCYLEAYLIRQKRRSVEQQYGFRAFIGAGRLQPQRKVTNPAVMSASGNSSIALEIAASGREGDINNLIGRISRADYKLIVIHGPSGVGKSSTVTAGLIPALQNRAIGDQIAIPVVLQIYTNWVRELGKALTAAMSSYQTADITTEITPNLTPLTTIDDIRQQLQKNAHNHLITVLIFDQFEEFFFSHTNPEATQEFDLFISECLNISFVKLILSLREDYLHRLLDFKHLAAIEAINQNILDKNIRYQLNNFSPEYAKDIIHKLTARSQLHLEPALIDAIVEDLSVELGEVRPIELQVVGAQIQDERITCLSQYQPYRPKKLIERYIKELIKDCGPDNERAALIVLYLLTDEGNQRPFKTQAELSAQLAEIEESNQLELILKVLVNSGLVVLFPDVPERYQLIHDYLVDLIRYLQQQELSLQIQLDQLRDKVENSQKEIERLKIELRQKKQEEKLVESQQLQGLDLLTELRKLRKREELSQLEIEYLRGELKEKELTTQLAESQKQQRLSEAKLNQKLNRSLKIALTASAFAILGLTIGVITSINSEIKTLSASSQALFASQKGIDALKDGVKAGKKLKHTVWVDSHTREQVLSALYQGIYGLKERNRLEGHSSGVNSVNFSPDQSLIASASADTTIKLWLPNGSLINTLSGHEDVVNSVSFSPDSQIIISGSQDQTVKLWNKKGDLLNSLTGHESVVNSAIFSPDGEIIASASKDKTIKLWHKDGTLITTLKGHDSAVLDLAWSPDGKTLASGSADNTVKLWSREGELLKTLTGCDDAVKSVTWSPDGKIIVAASLDKNIRLWSPEGKLLRVLSGHTSGVTSISFSKDGQTLASASIDETIKLWSLDGSLLGTLRGHNDWVNSVNFSPDGDSLISAGRDKTIKIWRWDDVLLRDAKADYDSVTSISFSPDGRNIAAASKDGTVKLWSQDGKLLKIFKGHQDEVWGVAWSPDGKNIASASKDKTVKIWSREGQLINTFLGHKDTVLTVAWSLDGKIIASAGNDTTIKLWSRQGKLLKTLSGHSKAVNWISFSPDGQLLVSASDDESAKIWSKDGQIISDLDQHTRPVNGVAWSPDGQIIASVSLDGMVKIWDRKGNLQKTLGGEGDSFIGVSFSPDGRILAVNSDDKIRLWTGDGTPLMVLKGDKDELTSVSFSPDRKILAAGSGDGTIVLRNLSDTKLDMLLQQGCDLLQDYLHNNPKVTGGDRSLCLHQSVTPS
jgi:WD40 repeat protein